MRRMAFGLVARLCRDSRGAILIIAFLPLLWVAAMAMDVSRVLVVKQRCTNAVDAAALAVGRQLGHDDTDITALVQGFISAHYTAADVGAPTNLAVASTETQVAAVLSPGYGPNYNCVAASILPLTNVKATINSPIDAMVVDCNTVIPEGLDSSWRVLSPGAPFTEGTPHDDQATIKIVVLLTAAANSISGTSGQNHSDFSGYGFAASDWLGGRVPSPYVHLYHGLPGSRRCRADHPAKLRSAAKPEPRQSALLRKPDSAALQGVFANIALGLNQLRLAN